MTIFLAMAQRKILPSPGLTATFLPFHYVLTDDQVTSQRFDSNHIYCLV